LAWIFYFFAKVTIFYAVLKNSKKSQKFYEITIDILK
jgi:hypothetical protein